MSQIYLSNLVKSPEDKRDFKYAAAAAPLPRKVDLRQYAGGIEQQGRVGSCTANATCSALELMTQRADKFEDLSRLFVYYETRLMENRIGQDGANLRDALKAANKIGVPAEIIWPYDISKVDTKPSDDAYADATKRMLTRYEAVELSTIENHLGYWDALNNVKAALAEGLPVIFAMSVNRTIFDLKGPLDQQKYETRDPATMRPYESIGNHAMVFVGYDDDKSYLVCEGSWSEAWGDKGYMALPYGVFGGSVFEAWAVRGFNGIEIVKPEPVVPPAPEPIPEPPKPEPRPLPEPIPDPMPPQPEPPAPTPEPVAEKSSSAGLIAAAIIVLIVLAYFGGIFK